MSTAIIRFARFDLSTTARTQPARVLLPLLFIVVLAATLPAPGLGIVVGAVIAAVSASIPFQGDERGRLDTLYGVAPIGRTAVVLGRYVTMIAFGIAAVGVGTVTAFVSASLRHQELPWPLVATMLLAAVACVGVSYAFQLPWFFLLGFTRGRPMIYIPVAIVAVAGFIAGRVGWLEGIGLADVLAPAPGVAALVLIGVIALLGVSAAVSVRVYRRREL